MDEKENLEQKVLEENEKHHDVCAPSHTAAVPYQSRPKTRKYIWSLINKQLKKHNIKPSKETMMLEMACGTGTFGLLAQKWGVKQYDGVDISAEMIKYAKINHENNKIAYFYKDSLENWTENNQNKYDIIITSSFLHHVVDLEKTLIQLQSMLKPDGIFIGLHERNNAQQDSELEVFDYNLAKLNGYIGFHSVPFKERLRLFKEFYKKRIDEKIFKKVDKNVQSDGYKKNYIDYQLNFPFNLETNETARKYGEAIPYCYYNFIEFKLLKNRNNHCMFVMIKNTD